MVTSFCNVNWFCKQYISNIYLLYFNSCNCVGMSEVASLAPTYNIWRLLLNVAVCFGSIWIMNNKLPDYPLRNNRISLKNREIQLTIVDQPDQLLEKLSKENSDGTLYLPYWTYLWNSSIGLAHHIAKLGNSLSGKNVLEIGCGYGLAGIVASLTGAKVVFTDFENDALLFARYNILQNGVNSANIVQMDWNAACFRSKFDVILASDVIYEEQNWKPIIGLLQGLLEPNGVAIFSEPDRKNADGFFISIRENGFTFEKTTCDILVNQKTSSINIFTIKRV